MTAALSDAARATVVELYEAGLTLRQVGQRVGMSHTAVKTRLLEAGVRPRTRHDRPAVRAEAIGALEVQLQASVRRAEVHAVTEQPAPRYVAPERVAVAFTAARGWHMTEAPPRWFLDLLAEVD